MSDDLSKTTSHGTHEPPLPEGKAAVGGSVESLVGQVAEEFIAARERGENPDIDEFASRYPRIASVLRQVLPALDVLRSSASASADDRASDSTVPPPALLGDFRIIREIGRGGMGVVYEAEQVSMQRRVALKILPFAAVLDPRQLQRFKNEAVAAGQLQHQNIVPVYSVGCERGVHFYAMQFIEGQTIAEVIRELRRSSGIDAQFESVGNALRGVPHEGAPVAGDSSRSSARNATEGVPYRATSVTASPLAALSTELLTSPREYFRTVARLGIQAAEALDHAHQIGIIHRDIKPSNLLLDVRGNLWVTDFGLARILAPTPLGGEDRGEGRDLTLTGDFVGTLRYMSPEQALAQRVIVDHRTDIYSLGVTLYEMFTLRPVFDGSERHELLRQIASEEPSPPRQINDAIPPDLETIVLKAIAKEVESRYATARDLADDLRRFLDHQPILAKRPGLVERVAKWSKRHRTLVQAGFAFLIVAVVGLAIATLLIGRARFEAERRRLEADEQRRLALDRERAVRRHLYVADIRLAHQAWRTGNVDQTLQVLQRYESAPAGEDQRGFEWHYLWQLCHHVPIATYTLSGHAGEVYAVAFSPDGQTLASGGQDGQVIFWDPATGKPKHTFRAHDDCVNSLAFSPNGELLVTASCDRTAKLWDTASARMLNTVETQTKPLFFAAFSPDGGMLATGSEDGVAKLWDVATVTEIATLEGRNMAFSPDGESLATGMGTETKVWGVPSGQERFTLGGHQNTLAWLQFSNDGRILATAGNDTTVRLWDIKTRRELFALRGHRRSVQSVVFSPDDLTLSLADRNGFIAIWDLSTRTLRNYFQAHGRDVFGLTISPDGRTLVSASVDGTVKLWDMRMRQDRDALPGYSGEVRSVAFSPNGRWLATAGADPDVKVWDTREWKVATKLIWDRPGALTVAFSPDDLTVAVLDSVGTSAVYEVGSWRVTAQLTHALEAGGTRGLVFTPDGNVIAVGERRAMNARLWQFAQRTTDEFPQTHVVALAFSPDGTTLAVGRFEIPFLELWDYPGRRLLRDLSGHEGEITGLLFSPDGKTLVSTSRDMTARLWDRETGSEVMRFLGHSAPVNSVALSPHGRTIVTASDDGTVKLWDIATGSEFFTLEGHSGRVLSVAFAPDGKTLVTGGETFDRRGECYLWPGGTIQCAIQVPE